MVRLASILLAALLLSACATRSQELSSLTRESLNDNVLVYGSIWVVEPARGGFNEVLWGQRVGDQKEVRLEGDDQTVRAGPEGVGEIRLFSVMLPPGDYQFTRYGGRGVESGAVVERFEAGEVIYAGQLVCIDVWFTCRWLSIDQLGRDLYYASEAQPDIPWHQTQFAFADISSSQLDFRRAEVRLDVAGPARHKETGVNFAESLAGFERINLQSNGSDAGGALFSHPSGMEAQVLVYPMNVVADSKAESGLRPRLREVVLNREAELALSAWFAGEDFEGSDIPSENYGIYSDLYFLQGDSGLRSGRRLDAIGYEEAQGSRVRYVIFSIGRWLVRFRFTWQETESNASDPETGDAPEAIEELMRNFIKAQDWPQDGVEEQA